MERIASTEQAAEREARDASPAGQAPQTSHGIASRCLVIGAPINLISGLNGIAGCAGIAVRLAPCEDEGGTSQQIVLVGVDGTIVSCVGTFHDDEIIAAWRSLALWTGLPMMVLNEDGSVSAPFAQIGRLQLGTIRIRRRHGLLAGRRPRFLVRRKSSALPPRPVVHRGEEFSRAGF